MAVWSPWTGCTPYSDGCKYCYYYGEYSKRKGAMVIRSDNFNKPLEMKTKNKLKLESGSSVATCFESDFFIQEADAWRSEAWDIIKKRPDLHFLMLTKRIDRFYVSLPGDWGDGYDNVTIGCTCENQKAADYRLPIFLEAPIKHRIIICSPLLGSIDLSGFLHGIEHVTVGGEQGRDARECNFDWVLSIREQCRTSGVSFSFKCTGRRFIKDNKLSLIDPKKQHSMARELGINLEQTDSSIEQQDNS